MATYLKAVAIFCLTIVPVSLCYDNIDAFMTGDQIRQVFEAEPGSVPMHEVVAINFPHLRNKREDLPAGSHVSLQVFGQDIQLWLHPIERVLFGTETPIYFARFGPNKPGKVEFARVNYALPRMIQLWENPQYLASLVIGVDAYGRFRAHGHFAKMGVAMKSLPNEVVDEYKRNRRSIDNVDLSNSTCHVVVYKINETIGERHSIAAIDKSIFRERTARSTAPIPSVIYPEILVVVDHSKYRRERTNLPAFLEYLVAFWNGVDLKYRAIQNPKVRLHISAVVIGLEPKATPYIENHMLDDDHFDVDRAYNESKYFFYSINETIPTASYDIALTMTRFRMKRDGKGGIVGVATPRGLCTVRENATDINSVAFIQDWYRFAGVPIAAHELGHTLGFDHDDEIKDWMGYCKQFPGYIMASGITNGKNSSEFSHCSILRLQIELESLKCLYNVPKSLGEDMPKLMPGRVSSLEAQCFTDAEGTPCNVTTVDDICLNYHCINFLGRCRGVGPALDGTPCGDPNSDTPKFCFNQRCVHL